jgi:O-acetylhomoserine (thiol)-lyase
MIKYDTIIYIFYKKGSIVRTKTKGIHFGYNKDSQKTMSVPIYMSTAYEFDNIDYASDLFSLKQEGNIYTRLNNPTTDIFEKRMASMEGATYALATSSGMSAIFYALVNCANINDNILCAKQLYGGSITQSTHTLKRFGIEARFFDVHNIDELESLIDDNTKAIFFESLSNPSIDIADIEAITKIADKYNIISIVDNTVATPILCKPFSFGADVVVHSASKYTTGQGIAIGGILIESDNIKNKIKNNKRYPHFNTPDESYHSLVFADKKNPFCLRARLVLLRDLGGVLSPFNSWIFIQGLETLYMRMKEHSKNALKIAQFLNSHPKIKKVSYPSLEEDKNYKNAQKYLKKGMASGLLSFEVDNFEIAKNIANNTKIFTIVANIGDSKSIITHPASTTHQQLNSKEMQECGISESLIRLSVGLECADDLIEDLQQAIK